MWITKSYNNIENAGARTSGVQGLSGYGGFRMIMMCHIMYFYL
jgi:hypothetical protein